VKRIGVYPGTFDPVTNGHLDLADRGRRQFDKLVIGVLNNNEKEPLFSVTERVALLRGAIRGWDNVEVEAFDGLLVDFAERVGASMILRGIRAVTDLEYEMQMAMMNRRMNQALETVFLVPGESYSFVSSRLVREVARLGGSTEGLVPPEVSAALVRHFSSGAPS
jgi:pantetheine-phosphate adenylyltransferase